MTKGLTATDRLAAGAESGWANDELPEKELREMLRPKIFLLPRPQDSCAECEVVLSLRSAMVRYRAACAERDVAMRREEIVTQGEDLAKALQDVQERLTHLNSALEAYADEWVSKSLVGNLFSDVRVAALPYLGELQDAIEHATEQVRMIDVRPGAKSDLARAVALDTVAASVERNLPEIKVQARRRLAADLLAVCGISFPADDKELRTILSLLR